MQITKAVCSVQVSFKKKIILSYVSAKPLSLLLKVEVISHFISVSTRTF